MTIVLVWLLTVNLQVGSYAVPNLPDNDECNRLGKLQTIGWLKATYDCKSYKSVVGPGNLLLAK